MSENRTKITNRKKYNVLVINRLKEKYGLSMRYIHMSLNGDRKSETSDLIIKDYKELCTEVDKALKSNPAK
jgi:hypothetical protein